jgi:hypothetical protein
MPNPVAVNDLSPISGSLQTSRVSYGVETAGKNYGQNYNSTNWYSDIPNNGQFYTIISDNYTANYYVSRSNAGGAYVEGGLPAVDDYSAPVFWITQGTSSLDVITIVNGLPDRIGQVPFNSGSQALNWVASSSNYFAVGPDYYADIDADNLIFYINGNQIISYPTTGSTWYDLSGYFMKGTLTNGTTWNSNDYMVFDGTDDYINFGNNSTFNVGTTGSLSIDILFKTTDTTGALVTKRLGSGPQVYVNGSKFYADGGGTAGVSSANNVNNNRWNKGTAIFDRASSLLRLYVNGVADNTTAFGSTTLTDTSDLYLGTALLGTGIPHDFYTGSIAEVLIYPKALTAAEVAQNYYGGPVVTGSISGSYNAGNLVSFQPGTTTTFNMAANIISGSLQNGVGYSPANGGYWSFDGTDDRILLEGSTTNAWVLNSVDSWTVNAWIRVPTGAYNSAIDGGYLIGPILANTAGGPIYSVFQINGGTIAYTHYNGVWLTKYGTAVVNDGNWHMLTWSNSSNSMNLYVDGITNGTVNSTVSNTNPLDVIGNSLGTALLGDIASVQINKGKAFTAAEVLQQYNATK